jgi:hypothetical protein
MMDYKVPYFTYRISDGELNLEDSATTTFMGTGYSGKGYARNKRYYTHLVNQGPIPEGWYTLNGPFDHYINSYGHRLGNQVFRLITDPNNRMFSRSGFALHGDNVNHDASEGCIIMGPTIRNHIVALFAQGIANKLKVI